MENKIFIDSLPRTSRGIKWSECKGKKVRFIYNGIDGYLTIKDVYISKHSKVLIEFKGRETVINTSHFVKCNLLKLLNNRKKSDFKYNKGYKTKNMLSITDRFYDKDSRGYSLKKYLLKCCVCNSETTLRESQIDITGCPVCNNKKVIKGINDISTKRPDLVKYFYNKDDAYNHTTYSEYKAVIECPLCKEKKIMRISDLSKNGIGCLCGTGFSYAERFMYYILKSNDIKFTTQYSIKNAQWCGKYRYDFYLYDYNIIIETHGEQHYTHSFIGCGGDSLETVKENDINKKKLALSNGIYKYIEIDCSKSKSDFIINSLKKSYLSKIIDIDNTDIKYCEQMANGNIIKTVCDKWNELENVTKVLNSIDFIKSRTTIIKYLKRGNDLGLCDYNPKEELVKSIKSNSYYLNKKYKLS